MKKWQKILATAGVVATLGAGLTGCAGCTKTVEDVPHKYLILKQFDRNYTLHCLLPQNESYKYDAKCGVGVFELNTYRWIMTINQDYANGSGYIEAFFSCKDEDAVRKIGYEDVCQTCFPDGYEQE